MPFLGDIWPDIGEIVSRLISNYLGCRTNSGDFPSVRDDPFCSGNFIRQLPGTIGPIVWTILMA